MTAARHIRPAPAPQRARRPLSRGELLQAVLLLLQGVDALPAKQVFAAFKIPHGRCPRASCRGEAFATGNGWACLDCGALGGPGNAVAAWLGISGGDRG